MPLNERLTDLLKQTSRSFYLTLRVLPRPIRSQISLAYLLARTTDTIADTELVPLEQRLEALNALRERISGNRVRRVDFSGLLEFQSSTAERALLENSEEAITVLKELSLADAELVRAVLHTITSGQELDLKRFSGASTNHIVALETDAELDDYMYRVAGCVGEFWTKMCRAHLFPKANLNDGQLVADGVRFGKGLQLVNILRDLPVDLRKGRCYLPANQLSQAGLAPGDLLRLENEMKFRPLYDSYLALAKSHLTAGWAYTNTIPRRQMRVRLACAWPILIGMKTIQRLHSGRILDPQQHIKICRGEVRRIIFRSVLFYFWPSQWQGQFQKAPLKTIAPCELFA